MQSMLTIARPSVRPYVSHTGGSARNVLEVKAVKFSPFGIPVHLDLFIMVLMINWYHDFPPDMCRHISLDLSCHISGVISHVWCWSTSLTKLVFCFTDESDVIDPVG